MRVICILCDRPFQPDKLTEKKIRKYPHRIQICPDCYERVKIQALQRRKNSAPEEPQRPFGKWKRRQSWNL